VNCNQDCKRQPRSLSDGQLGWLYFFMLMLALLVVVLFNYFTSKPMSAEQYASKFCQELYGPQSAAHWAGDRMMCLTQRGEVLPAKRP
jgi:hypothetical protein